MMQQIAPGKHQMSHYAFASGIMNLSVMLTGAVSGLFERLVRIQGLLPGGDVGHDPRLRHDARLIPFTYPDEKK